MKTFKELGLDAHMLSAVDRLGYTTPTGIQEKAIPLILEGKDIIAGSATGSGKTFAFASGLIQNLAPKQGVQVLVLVPTRELAEQVNKAVNDFAKFKKLNTAVIYGGVSFNPQFDALRRADIIVATPGRLLDHLQRGSVKLDNVRHLVLDEADMMLDMGFIPDVTRIIQYCPSENRQTLLFSATMAPEIRHLAKDFMKNPQKLSHETYVDSSLMDHCFYVVPNNLKLSLLVHLAKAETHGLVMVFCNSRRITESVAKGLQKNGLDAQEIHGGLSQSRRTKILADFHKNKLLALVCTDVAARGLDIPDVTHIYNYDIPNDPNQYVHRSGRTARAGKGGSVINILSDRDFDNFNRVISDNRELNIVEKKRPFLERIELPTEGNRNTRNTGNRTGEKTGYGRRGHFGTSNNQRTSGGRGDRGGYNSDRAPRRDSSRNDSPRNSFSRDSGSRDSSRSSRGGQSSYSSGRSSYGAGRSSDRGSSSYGGSSSRGGSSSGYNRSSPGRDSGSRDSSRGSFSRGGSSSGHSRSSDRESSSYGAGRNSDRGPRRDSGRSDSPRGRSSGNRSSSSSQGKGRPRT